MTKSFEESTISCLKINQGIFSGVREVDDTVRELRKENFNLKLRIYFLEERLGKFLMIIAV